MKLEGQTALITGASRGIGQEIALAFAREGAAIAVTARSAADLESLKSQVSGMGGRCVAVVANLAERGAVDYVYEQTQKELGEINILVNNAGIGSSDNPKPVASFDDTFWELSLYLNLTVPYLFCKKVLPAMMARRYGRIIMTASIN
ncbi:MAG: SDR family NAD(P)-dependent oxidoreductase, partial [Chloroflexi bacterium]|nr:SDR family NAD(P)-dependent oxidoreductase [Chloroflexota bacterium]